MFDEIITTVKNTINENPIATAIVGTALVTSAVCYAVHKYTNDGDEVSKKETESE